MAYGLSKIHTSKYGGWRFIFIVEGAMTIAAAIVARFFIVDFPQLARFLRDDEKVRAIERLNKDRGDGEHDQITAEKVFRHLRDWKLWGFALIVALQIPTATDYSFLEPLLHVMRWRTSLRIFFL